MKFTNEQVEMINIWFQEDCFDLSTIGKTSKEKQYLEEIKETAYESGVISFLQAKYILALEKRIEELDKIVAEILFMQVKE